MNANEIIERLTKIPKNQRMLIYVGSYILVAILYLFLFYFPNQDKAASLERQISDKRAKLELVQNQVKSLDELMKESQDLKAKLNEAQKELPQGAEIPELIKSISETGRKVGLEIRQFQPLEESPSITNTFVAEVPISLAVEGTFHQVAMFFDRLSKMERIVHVKNIDIEIAEEEGTNVSLLVEGSAITFRFLSDEERMKKKSKKKKRR